MAAGRQLQSNTRTLGDHSVSDVGAFDQIVTRRRPHLQARDDIINRVIEQVVCHHHRSWLALLRELAAKSYRA